MSAEEDIQTLRRQIWEYSQAHQTCQQENTNLQHRVAELYEWSQKAQQVIQERDAQIHSLSTQIETLNQKEQDRLHNRTEVTVDDLYEKVQRLEMQNRSLEEQTSSYSEIIEKIYINSSVDRSSQSKIEKIFKHGKDPQQLILIEMRKNPSTSFNDLARAIGIALHQVKIAADQLQRKGFIKGFGSGTGVTISKGDILPSLSDVSGWNSITDPKDLFNALLEYTKVSDQHIMISEALKKFRDILTSLIGSPVYMHEISRSINDYRISMGNKQDLLEKTLSWQDRWESSVKGSGTYGTSLDLPSSWDSNTPFDELFSSMKQYIQRASNLEVASSLEKIRDILHEQHGHALYLSEIAREASRWKNHSQNQEELVQKLKKWKKEADQR